MNRQSRKHSIFEVISGTVIGYLVAILSQVVIFPQFDIDVTLESNLWIGAYFTIVSLVRGYVVRRAFNKIFH